MLTTVNMAELYTRHGLSGKSGVYVITNTETAEQYVGSTRDLGARLGYHRAAQRGSARSYGKLNAAFQKHSLNNFTFSVIELCEPERLLEKEQNAFSVYAPEYNAHPTAGSPSGYTPTAEHRKRISEGGRGREMPKGFGEGKKMPSWFGEWIAAKNQGSKRTPEQRKRMSDAKKRYWKERKSRESAIAET